jgi:hypothetical protein
LGWVLVGGEVGFSPSPHTKLETIIRPLILSERAILFRPKKQHHSN